MSAISQISCSNIVIAECRDYLQGREREGRERQGLLPVSATGAACQLSVASDHVTGVKSPTIHLLRMKLALEFVLLLLGCCLVVAVVVVAYSTCTMAKLEKRDLVHLLLPPSTPPLLPLPMSLLCAGIPLANAREDAAWFGLNQPECVSSTRRR